MEAEPFPKLKFWENLGCFKIAPDETVLMIALIKTNRNPCRRVFSFLPYTPFKVIPRIAIIYPQGGLGKKASGAHPCGAAGFAYIVGVGRNHETYLPVHSRGWVLCGPFG
jgi:hypothetical protein